MSDARAMDRLLAGNGEVVALGDVPDLSPAELRGAIVDAVESGGQIAAFSGAAPEDGAIPLLAAIAHASDGRLELLSTLAGGSFPSLAADCPQAAWFEREIAEQWGVAFDGHPWPKPLRFAPPRRGGGVQGEVGVADFFRVEGDEVHEVAVGPVHAGVIEPGHFRFQCHGEEVLHLEISLGYQHRGVERALLGGPDKRTLHYVETLAGDTTIGHAVAACEAFEALAGCHVPAQAQALRGIALELERLANHVGDLGALAGDVGYLPAASFCGRLRGDFLNMTADLCGNRFGRSFVKPGGVRFDVPAALASRLSETLARALRDTRGAVELLWETPSVLARFEGTGAIDRETSFDIGLVGVAARAAGIARDVRQDFPSGIFRFAQIPVPTWHTGDVFARAYVRWLEVQHSVQFLSEQLRGLPGGEVARPCGPLAPSSLVATLAEGFRGQICHVYATGPDGRIAHAKVVDPSFHNWLGLALAMRGQQISDFPLCNKSFNLSYCGFDL